MKLPDKLTNAINGGLIRVTTARDSTSGSRIPALDKDALIEVAIRGIGRTVYTLNSVNGSSRLVAHIHPHGSEWVVDVAGAEGMTFDSSKQADDCFDSICEGLLP